MQRQVIESVTTGGPEVLVQTSTAVPDLTEGQIRVRGTFAGINFWDVMQRRGDVSLPPDRVPGVEGVGVVEAVGAGVDAALLGQRVAWSRVPSSYADVVVGPQASFLPVPDSVSDEVAAGCLMQGVTAHYLATSTTDLHAGQSAVVTAAAGGVGRLLTQMLQQRGVDVIGVVGSPDKVDASCADVTIDPSRDRAAAVRDRHPAGVDAVFDASGASVLPLLVLLRPRGICVVYGSASGTAQEIPLSALSAGSLYLTRTAGRDYSATPAEWRHRAEDVMAGIAAGSLTVLISGTFPLAEASLAHELLESRRTTGKLLLRTAH